VLREPPPKLPPPVLRELLPLPLPKLLRLDDDELEERVALPEERVDDDEDDEPTPLLREVRVLPPEVRTAPEVLVLPEPKRVALEGL
jgi:hypothetical protein